jgi:hypothetical protein
MAMTFQDLTEILKGHDIVYWANPDRPSLMFGMAGASGRRFMLGASVDGEGAFFQARSLDYLHCPMNHPNFPAVARVLLALNYQYRAVKFGVDPNDGEVTAYADLVLLDAQVTSSQVMGLLGFFLNVLDASHGRLQTTLVTGADPGEPEAGPAPAEEKGPEEEDDVV